jgi:hypothetical protein
LGLLAYLRFTIIIRTGILDLLAQRRQALAAGRAEETEIAHFDEALR